MRLHQESLLLFRMRHLRETLGVRLCGLLEYSCVNILPQITQITQTNTAWLYYYAEKDRLEIVLFWGLGFVCDYQRDLRETSGVLFVLID